MIKKLLALLCLAALLSGCSSRKTVYQEVYLDVFDTVTTLRGYETNEERFRQRSKQVHQALLEYHRLFDIYHDCPGGLKQVNDNAGLTPVKVDERVMELLLDCRADYEQTYGKVNAAMGSVLRLWHKAREQGLADPASARLPDIAQLQEAAKHCSFDSVLLDEENSTVFLSDPQQRLDVGAIAKGWVAQRVSELLPEGYMLNLGGNVCALGSKPDGSPWRIGIQSPMNLSENLCVVNLADCCAVTSGDYQRCYSVDGKSYHHIIDPQTLMPSEYWRSVTILCSDSGLADCLSTALFLLPLEEGKALAESCNAEAMWVDAAGNIRQTDGFAKAVQG